MKSFETVYVVNYYTVFLLINLGATESGKFTSIEDSLIVFSTNFSRLQKKWYFYGFLKGLDKF